MPHLTITLFGKPSIRYGDDDLDGCEASKVQELLCYLLLHRNRPHARETLASLLWGNACTTAQSKKYLRKTIWQLQTALNPFPALSEGRLLLVEPDWIELRPISELRLDVAMLEEAYAAVKGMPGTKLDEDAALILDAAVRLYRGYALENWYQEWCLCERERLHQIYLILLDKLTSYSEARHAYEVGLSYGRLILQYDRARERTHQQMMRLYYLSGDRTGALRQYERCLRALEEELDVGPAHSTTTLYERIRQDRALGQTGIEPSEADPDDAVERVAALLHQIQKGLEGLQLQVRHALSANGIYGSGPGGGEHESFARRTKERGAGPERTP